MKDLLEKILQNVDYDPPGWEGEFYVSIGKAAELSGLSESQIRYFESLSGINIGQREGPKERNRVYTKHDVVLLRAVYQCADARPAEIAQVIKKHQELILERLGQVTLPQIIQHEEHLSGQDFLITGLVAVLLSLWQEAASPQGSIIQGVILGPQKDSWRASLLQDIKSKSFIDLAGSLVIWSTDSSKATTADCKIFFSHRSWYLPFANNLTWDTRWFDELSTPFAVAILWQLPHSESRPENPERLPSLDLDEPAMLLTNMLMRSLKQRLDCHSEGSGEPVSVYSRGSLGPAAVIHGLSLLLDSCIQPYFSDCYSYVAEFREDGTLGMLREHGNPAVGYVSQFVNGSHTLDTRRMPWWITFAKEQASIALDRDSTQRPSRREERGSVVCIPLVGQDQVLGVLAVENTSPTEGADCLRSRDGINGPTLLRYLICTAEIAAGYLNHRASSLERIERSRLAYTRHETIDWYWNIYQEGGLNYSRAIEEILDWTGRIGAVAEKQVNVVVVDIAREDVLAKEYKGFDIIISLLQATQARIREIIQNDPIASTYTSKNQLVLFNKPVADHIVLSSADIPKEYLLVFLERIRRIWLTANDTFVWDGKEIGVSLQVGFCNFPGLGLYERGIATELMKHHLWVLANQMFEKTPLKHVFQYDAVVPTE